MEKIYENSRNAIKLIPEIVMNLRAQHFYHASIQIINLSTLLGSLLEYKQDLIELAQNMMLAQESNNYILLADILEYDLIPALLEVQMDISKDMEAKGLEDIESTLEESDFYVMRALNGEPCIYHLKDQKQLLMCSSVNPSWEANQLVTPIMSNQYDRYIVFGIGAGYHITKILEKDPICQVLVLEERDEIVSVAKKIQNFEIYKDRLEIRCVKAAEDFVEVLSTVRENDYLFVHYPSLQLVCHKEIKLVLENYFVQASGIAEQKANLDRNFKYISKKQFEECTGLISVLKDREVMLVAGGPSVDKDIEKIKQNRERYKIVAVSRIAKKLMDAGIVPDIVVVIDSGIATMDHFVGWKHEKIPLIILSTAYYDLVNIYKGPIFVAYQRDYVEAEQYVEKKAKEGVDITSFETGGSVSTFALDMIIRAGAKSITLVGLDLAYTHGKTHASGANELEIKDNSLLRKVRGNKGNYVYTAKNLDIYRIWIEKRIQREDAPIIYNTSEGAYINGAVLSYL